ncbi:hypothetical protein NPIL_264411 [Nephila pilipes]|uniref:Uncharacterized protein n=1 Tax=Nephila pilipes TaxID=299642 RepID=A0A8X6UBI5_NEPPI|nr:hypothetical protein NPIL_264411 [Nephila pilipes]
MRNYPTFTPPYNVAMSKHSTTDKNNRSRQTGDVPAEVARPALINLFVSFPQQSSWRAVMSVATTSFAFYFFVGRERGVCIGGKRGVP